MTELSQAQKIEIVEKLVGKELTALVAYQVSRAATTDDSSDLTITPEPCLQDQFYLLLIDKLIESNPFSVPLGGQ